MNINPCPSCAGTEIDPEGWSGGQGEYGPECLTCGMAAPSVVIWNRCPQPSAPVQQAVDMVVDRIGVYLVDVAGYKDTPERAHVLEIIREELGPYLYASPSSQPTTQPAEYCDPPCVKSHEHFFCPHCRPCRLAPKLGEAEDALRRLASSFGGNGFTSLEFSAAELEKRIHDGFDDILRVEIGRARSAQPQPEEATNKQEKGRE